MANASNLDLGSLEAGLERARQQMAYLKSLGAADSGRAAKVQARDTIAADLERIAKGLRGQNDRAMRRDDIGGCSS